VVQSTSSTTTLLFHQGTKIRSREVNHKEGLELQVRYRHRYKVTVSIERKVDKRMVISMALLVVGHG